MAWYDYLIRGGLGFLAGGPAGAVVGMGSQGVEDIVDATSSGDGSGAPESAWTPEGYGWLSPTTGKQKSTDIWGAPPLYESSRYGGGMVTPTSKPVQTARKLGGQSLDEQRAGLAMLRGRAEGKDSVARQAGQREREATQRQIVSTARSGRRTPAAARTALLQTSAAGQMISGKIAEAESKERLAAQKAYFAAASGMRGDALKQQQGEQQWWGMKADWERVKKEVLAKYLALGLQDKEAERRARIDYQKLLAGIFNKAQQHEDEMDARDKEAWMGLASSGIQALATLGGAQIKKTSDVRAKTNIKPAGYVTSDERAKTNMVPMMGVPQQGNNAPEDIENLLDNIAAYEYDYKPGFGPPGKQVGVMAQDLERSPMGAKMVSNDGPAGAKMVDYSPESFNPVAMAALANLNDRVSGIEGASGEGAPQTLNPQQGTARNAMIGAGSELNRPVPTAPQQGLMNKGSSDKPDINAVRAMLAQMGGI